MRILRERPQFQADHSSTSYLFYSPHRLDEKTTRLAASFSSRARVDLHTAAYTYNVEGYSLPSDAQEKLFAGSFEVMVSESYDWWTFAVAVPYSVETLQLLGAFEVVGPDDTGVWVEPHESAGKIRITIHCRLASDGDWMDTRRDPFKRFVRRLLDLRGEVARGDTSGLQLIAAQFDELNRESPPKASESAEWLACNIEV